MSEEPMNSLEDLLDQHDYELPELGDIRMGVIVANTPVSYTHLLNCTSAVKLDHVFYYW